MCYVVVVLLTAVLEYLKRVLCLTLIFKCDGSLIHDIGS